MDYVKSKIFFWRGVRIQIPAEGSQALESEADQLLPDDFPPEDYPVFQPEPSIETAPKEAFNAWPLARVLVPVGLAWLGQLALEPPNRSLTMGVILYLIAAAWVIWAGWLGDWQLAERQVEFHLGWQDLSFRPVSLMVSGVLSLVAFVAFGGNRFTTINVILWFLALVFFLRAVWQTDLEPLRWREKLGQLWDDFRWNGITFSPWTLLVLAAFALTVFFRFYMLSQVPGEMFSDHAEKLFDVADVLNGQYSIFFPRNTGREAFQMYLTAAMALIFKTGLSFMSLKLGTGLAGVFTLPFIYLTGKEIANRRVALLAMIFAGIAYWPNVISRVALRFTLYPFFFAPALYFLVKGFRRRSRNDFILAGLFLGLGLHGYSPFRFVPFVVLAAFGLYWLHRQSQGARKISISWLALTGFTSLIVFLPLARYWLSDPSMFSYRAMTRMTGAEQTLPGPAWQIFLQNTWKALTMFFWDNGEIWVHSVPHRPALDVISAVLFFSGVLLLIVRYLRQREWLDIFWLVSIPLLMMPSILSLAFPAENPSLNRTGAAIVPVFLIVGLSLDGLLTSLKSSLKLPWGRVIPLGLAVILILLSIQQNYDLVFHQYKDQFDRSSWNTSEIGAVIREFADTIGDEQSAWVIPYPYWVDTRLVAFNAGVPLHDYALWADQLETSLEVPGFKLFLFKPDDTNALERLQTLYPDGGLTLYASQFEGKDFYIYLVPPETP
ncbi:MAG TPA: hypothetical protein DEH22_16660 [Chloroflexi bacterium]|nr:hypothetical protein [Chloroflexota bacterium]